MKQHFDVVAILGGGLYQDSQGKYGLTAIQNGTYTLGKFQLTNP